jgi:hypothetical protein
MERFMKNKIFILALTTLFLSGLQAVNAQGIMNRIKKKAEEVTKPTQPTQTTQTTQNAAKSVVSNSKMNVKDVFREAAPIFRVTASENADKVITQTFESENRLIFVVPENLAISTEGTTKVFGEAKVFPTKNGGGLFVMTAMSCHASIGCGTGGGYGTNIQMISVGNGEPQLVTGLHLASYFTPNDTVVSLLKANKNYKKTVQVQYNPSYNFKDNKLNIVVDCEKGVCTDAFVVRSLTFDGEKFVESK